MSVEKKKVRGDTGASDSRGAAGKKSNRNATIYQSRRSRRTRRSRVAITGRDVVCVFLYKNLFFASSLFSLLVEEQKKSKKFYRTMNFATAQQKLIDAGAVYQPLDSNCSLDRASFVNGLIMGHFDLIHPDLDQNESFCRKYADSLGREYDDSFRLQLLRYDGLVAGLPMVYLIHPAGAV